jgi:hypothetical protein
VTATLEAPDTPVIDEPESEPSEFDSILPQGGRVEIAPGLLAEVRRLKSREFLLLMRVITRGLGGGISQVRLTGSDPEEMQQELLTLLMLAVPEAIEEFGDFLLAIVEPVTEAERAKVKQAAMNPDPDKLLDVLGVLVEQEKDDLSALVGKARAWLARIQRTVLAERRPTG